MQGSYAVLPVCVSLPCLTPLAGLRMMLDWVRLQLGPLARFRQKTLEPRADGQINCARLGLVRDMFRTMSYGIQGKMDETTRRDQGCRKEARKGQSRSGVGAIVEAAWKPEAGRVSQVAVPTPTLKQLDTSH